MAAPGYFRSPDCPCRAGAGVSGGDASTGLNRRQLLAAAALGLGAAGLPPHERECGTGLRHGCQHDLLFFYGAALTPPARRRSRSELRRMAIELPGEESEQLAAQARAYGCHIAFSAYVRDPDWPGRVLGLGVLLDDSGQVLAVRIPTGAYRLRHRRPESPVRLLRMLT